MPPFFANIKPKDLLKQNDIVLSVIVLLILGMMLIPLPAFFLDILLTLNIALAVTILLVTIYTTEPLQYSSFPTILLVTTLFRLGLNVSSTRLILLHGQAGSVIQSFGNFVVGGNYVVGVLIFIILVVINFMVITSGAGRVSEVAARFTLDAMPGKQISIDADMNAGIITEEEAKRRRKDIQREADFFGTMDGASKFVKGDATAGIIILVINIVAGFIIGVVQLHKPLLEAASTYTILTVGDGLVSQLPALVISAATGILVTRISATSAEKGLGDTMGSQMFGNPKVMGLVGVMMLLFAMVPGLPNFPFLVIGVLAAGTSFLLIRQEKSAKAEVAAKEKEEQEKPSKSTSRENVMELLQLETLELEIGYRLVPLLEAETGGDLLERVGQIRKQTAMELGIVLPSVRIRDNLQLPPNQYNVKLRGIPIATGEVRSDMWLAMTTDSEGDSGLDGIATKEPAFNLPALWIFGDQKESAETRGFTVVSPSAVINTHLTELIRKHASELITRSDVQQLLDHVKKQDESLVVDLIPDHLTLAEVQVVLQNLLKERVCIRDMASILEALSYHYRVSKSLDYLTEQCRMALSRTICKQYQNPDDNILYVVTMAPDVEEQIAGGISEDGQVIGLAAGFTQQLIQQLTKEVEKVLSSQGVQPVILCNARIRLAMRRFLERSLPQIGILSYNEVGPSIKAVSAGMVQLETLLV